MYLPSRDKLGYCNAFPVVSSDHFPALKSKRSSLCASTLKEERIRPSEDRRGANMPMLPGKVESCLVRRSTFCMLYLLGSPPPNCGYWAKSSELPSGDHCGPSSLYLSAGSSSSGLPPSEETKKSLLTVPSCLVPTKATCFPSGDQRGMAASMGGDESCNFSLPSRRLRHSVL